MLEIPDSLTYPTQGLINKSNVDAVWQDITLYSVAGWMSSWFGADNHMENGVAFGGYLQVRNDGILEGRLIDIYGQSVVEGYMSDELLHLEKLYIQSAYRRLPILYRLERKDNLWVGKFGLHEQEGGRVGSVQCVTTPAVQNSFGLTTHWSGSGEEQAREYVRQRLRPDPSRDKLR